MKKKLGIIVDNLERTFSENIKGGGSVVAKHIILELLQRDDVDLVVFSETCNTSNINVPFKIINTPHCFKKYNEEIDKIAKNEHFDKIISLNIAYPYQNYIIQSSTFKSRCKNIPFVIGIIKQFFSKEKIQYQEKRFKESNTKFYAVSNSIKEDYIKNLNIAPENIEVAYPGTIQFYEKCPKPNKNKEIQIGIVAGNSLNKGGPVTLLAFSLLKLLGYKFRLKIIAAKYDKYSFYSLFTAALGLKSKVTFFQRQKDMKSFYDSIDCLVLPSLNEAFGLVVLEAMACAKPCLISSNAGSAEIVEPETSFVYNRSSYFSYLKALTNVINIYNQDFPSYEKYCQNAFELSQKYTWKNFVDKIIE